MSGSVNTWMGDRLRVNHLGITSHLGQLSLPGSTNEYQQYAGVKARESSLSGGR